MIEECTCFHPAYCISMYNDMELLLYKLKQTGQVKVQVLAKEFVTIKKCGIIGVIFLVVVLHWHASAASLPFTNLYWANY